MVIGTDDAETLRTRGQDSELDPQNSARRLQGFDGWSTGEPRTSEATDASHGGQNRRLNLPVESTEEREDGIETCARRETLAEWDRDEIGADRGRPCLATRSGAISPN